MIKVMNSGTVAASEDVHVDHSDSGMVVCESAAASRIGRRILLRGGNAVDAAVATAMALAVAWPEAGNIGGGGFMMIRPADGQHPVCVDYRETAPLSMHRESFTKSDSTLTQKAVGVPGTVRGLAEAHRRYGRLPWKDLVVPSAELARDGFYVDAMLAGSMNGVLASNKVKSDDRFAELRRVYGKPDGSMWQDGDRMVLGDLATTLFAIAEDPDAFYSGRLADLLVAEMNRGNGQITVEDLNQYMPHIRPALRGTFRDYTILGVPPPSSGGTCIIQALNILENFELRDRDRYDVRNIHLIAEASRRVFTDRARHLGDPDFNSIPDFLTSKVYAKTLAATIDLNAATDSAQLAPDISLTDESPDTTHFSIVDGDGMAVSNTYTLEASWGSRIVVKGAGYVLNNEMGDFNWFPGITTRAGRIGTKPNQVAPGKRMLSSQSPMFVERNGKLILITGSPGGRTIINTTLCVILNVIEFGMDIPSAVTAARQHHQWFPDTLDLEDVDHPPHSKVADELRKLGHTVRNRASQGSAHSIGIDPITGIRTGVSDYRRGGRPAAISSTTLAVFDFSEPAGSSLTEVQAVGPITTTWTSTIAGATTDGKDHLRIHRPESKTPAFSTITLGPAKTNFEVISATIKIDGIVFAGDMKNEEVRFAFSDSRKPHQSMAQLMIGRDQQDRIVIHGQASGTSIPPFVLSTESRLVQPQVIRLTVDTNADYFTIESRPASRGDYTVHGTASIAAADTADAVTLSVSSDLAAPDEFVSIDRLEIRAR